MFSDVTIDDLNILSPFYSSLTSPLADLNAHMMVCWRKALGLKKVIQDDKIYVFGKLGDEYVGWGPPIGTEIALADIDSAFHMLAELNGNQESRSGKILYLWDKYHLWEEIQCYSGCLVEEQDREYIYSVNTLSKLPGKKFKNKRNDVNYFIRNCAPKVVKYCHDTKNGCLELLDSWLALKSKTVSSVFKTKMNLEYEVCKSAIEEDIPLEGVVVWVNGKVAGFSIGAYHGINCFNCMFEKTDLYVRGASVFVFSELAKMTSSSCIEINAGEDWGVDYLSQTKKRWHPSRTQKNHTLVCS